DCGRPQKRRGRSSVGINSMDLTGVRAGNYFLHFATFVVVDNLAGVGAVEVEGTARGGLVAPEVPSVPGVEHLLLPSGHLWISRIGWTPPLALLSLRSSQRFGLTHRRGGRHWCTPLRHNRGDILLSDTTDLSA